MWKHCLIWLLVVTTLPLLAPAAVKPQIISALIRDDYRQAMSVLGDGDGINARIRSLYRSTLATVADEANAFKRRDDDSARLRHSGDRLGEAMADIPGQWADTVKLQAYGFALRVAVLGAWVPHFLPLLICSAVVGVMERRLKRDVFASPSPPLYNTSVHGLLALLFCLILWATSPIPLPLAWLPMVFLLIAGLLTLAIANYPDA